MDGHPMLALWMKSFGDLLEVLRNQPKGSVVLEDECKNPFEPLQLIDRLGKRAFNFLLTGIGTGNHSVVETEIEASE